MRSSQGCTKLLFVEILGFAFLKLVHLMKRAKPSDGEDGEQYYATFNSEFGVSCQEVDDNGEEGWNRQAEADKAPDRVV